MYNVLLADDEPLVLIGLQSMLKWEEYDMTICGCARNGDAALELIEKLNPDIVIIDIKMPCKTGLEVAKICREKYGSTPQFIILTSFEELDYLREAIKFSVVDYLVKVELTPEILGEAITKAIEKLKASKPQINNKSKQDTFSSEMEHFSDKFFIRLLNNLFENKSQYETQKKDLNIETALDSDSPDGSKNKLFSVCYSEILGSNTDAMDTNQLLKLYSSTIRMVKECVDKYCTSYVISLDMRHFVVIFCYSGSNANEFLQTIKTAITQATVIVKNYFSVKLLSATGCIVNDLYQISESFNTSRLIFRTVGTQTDFAQYDSGYAANRCDVFDISKYKAELSRAFGELDNNALSLVITDMTTNLGIDMRNRVSAMDAACSLLYTAISLLSDGEEIISQIFSDEKDGFRCIYRQKTTVEITDWINKLGKGLCNILVERKQNYKSKVILNVQKYIKENLDKRLSLNDVADIFCFSPNYLSQLFTKTAGCSFVEYITAMRVEKAKQLLLQNDAKIYEIAESLGFESAFYFSKVFKKTTGFSPREFQHQKLVSE